LLKKKRAKVWIIEYALIGKDIYESKVVKLNENLILVGKKKKQKGVWGYTIPS